MSETATSKKYAHKEAFALMWYACICGHRERIWNSRDGVTPFSGLFCPSCGGRGLEVGGLSHVDWQLDQFAPNHKLHDGQRFFRNGTAEEAEAIIERRIAYFVKAREEIPVAMCERVRAEAREQRGEWKPGWPMVDRYRKEQAP
jgi:hypothetical protein